QEKGLGGGKGLIPGGADLNKKKKLIYFDTAAGHVVVRTGGAIWHELQMRKTTAVSEQNTTQPREKDRKLFIVLFLQAEDGIRYSSVTGVQTCALPILVCVCVFYLCALLKAWSAFRLGL